MNCLTFRFVLFLGVYLLGASLTSCQQAHGGVPLAEEAMHKVEKISAIPVKVQKAERRTFPLRTIATGVLEAARQAEMKFLRGGKLIDLPIQEGQIVERGALLAEVEATTLEFKLQQSQLALDEALVNKKDLLIANGGEAESDTSVSAQKLKLILTLSGYDKAQHRIKQTEYELSQTKVFAPFDGMIANVKTRAFQQVNPGESICTLIDPGSFEVAFSVLEQEALQLSERQSILVFPLVKPANQYRARISTINPLVNAQGLVRIKARLDKAKGNRLFEGQNAKVMIEKNLPDQLVIPKSALTLRSGREVVFTYDEKSGKAQWHYVQSAQQNDEYIVITEGLEAGEMVIYEGHLNLAHETAVVVQQ